MCLQMCLLFLLFFLEGNWKHYIQEVSSKLYTLLWKIFSHIIFRKVNAELIFTWKVHSSQTPHYKFYFFSPSREQRHSILIYCTFPPPLNLQQRSSIFSPRAFAFASVTYRPPSRAGTISCDVVARSSVLTGAALFTLRPMTTGGAALPTAVSTQVKSIR